MFEKRIGRGGAHRKGRDFNGFDGADGPKVMSDAHERLGTS